MSTYEPDVVRAILKNALPVQEQKSFEKDWAARVSKRMKAWKGNKETDMTEERQLRWEAEIIEYVDWVNKLTSIHGNAKAGTLSPSLKKQVPILGPQFAPPAYLHIQKRDVTPAIEPEVSYLLPFVVVHPFYYPNILNQCPECKSSNTSWDGWTGAGPRNVHGTNREERALGYQLRCKACKEASREHFCFATTNKIFWAGWEHWSMPRGIPIFFTRCAMTRELFDLIVELRPSSTSAGIAEHIKQLHLLEYKRTVLEYLTFFKNRQKGLRAVKLKEFSSPTSETGYNDQSITSDLVTDVYLDFINSTRQAESTEYCKTLTGECISLDNTFKAAKKAVVLEKTKERTRLLKGGVLSVLNEKNEIIGWRFCQSQSPAEITEVLKGLKERYLSLHVPFPEMAVTDNCCHVRRAIEEVFTDIAVVLDVHHFMRRYLATVLRGVKNPHYSMVAHDLADAILKQRAQGKQKAQYWPQAEQERRLIEAYKRWSERGDVWSAATSKVHNEQLNHVKKGCLARSRQDISSDGSRIEGSHKGWNSLQRSHPSGIEVLSGLAHDFVLRRNLRVTTSHPKTSGAFALSTFGSHHIRLCNHVAQVFNTLVERESGPEHCMPLPALVLTNSHEVFGLVHSDHAESFGGLIAFKDELDSNQMDMLDDPELDMDPVAMAHEMNIDLQLLSIPQDSQTCSSSPQVPKPHEKRKSPEDITDVDSGPPQAKRPRPGDSAFTIDAGIHAIFKPQRPSSTTSTLASHSTNVNLEPLPLPADKSSLTRSQLIFSLATQTDPRTLTIQRGDEFFLFMDLRAEHQWASFKMTSHKWVLATKTYNLQLQSSCSSKGQSYLAKNPRALMDKLSEIEQMVAQRIMTGNYLSKRTQTDTFWKRHCHSVSFIKTEDGSSKTAQAEKIRKAATCTRCKVIMYPGKTNSPENHKRGYCSDGVQQKAKSGDVLPRWPQPPGIFTMGTHFHPLVFLSAIRNLYEKITVPGADITMEDEAFSDLLTQRLKVQDDGSVRFQLYDLELSSETPQCLINEENSGLRYLHVHCLDNGP